MPILSMDELFSGKDRKATQQLEFQAIIMKMIGKKYGQILLFVSGTITFFISTSSLKNCPLLHKSNQ